MLIKYSIISMLLLLLALETGPSLAQSESGATDMRVFEEFRVRLQAATRGRDFSAIQQLYQTNGASDETMKTELGRWKELLDENTNRTPGMFFKEFAKLPPESHRYWTEYAHGLTDRKVTHVCALAFQGPAVQWALPLVMADGRLWIVPSEKRNRALRTY